MGYTNWARACIENDTGVTLTNVTLHHRYSDDPDEEQTWPDVGPGATTGTMDVHYNTGVIRYGQDYWWAQYTLPDGSVWVSPTTVIATLSSGDQGKTQTFTITGSDFMAFTGDVMQLNRQEDPQYNSWAVVVVQNNFPVAASVRLAHTYSDDQTFTHQFSPVPPGKRSAADLSFIVYFNTGFLRTGSDYWNVTVELDVPPYDNAPASAFAAFTNETTDKRCVLEAGDNGQTHVFSINGNGVDLGILSGACSDKWKTWNGYNTMGFIQVKNAFTTTLSTVVVTHKYSDDTTWRQTRALIPAGGTSPFLVVEYNTGFVRTGLDYWNVDAYLADETWYQNHKRDKECMLSAEDAVAPSTFTVSPSTLTLGLNSGSCSDSMDNKGPFSPLAGRDVAKPYDQNAFIGSHNAYANFAEGFWYAQQTGSLETQLGQGATTLLLDIWYDDGDVYLKHEGLGVLQPFVANQKLSQALATIRNFLQLQSRDPVTIIFEDSVDADHQGLIRQAFVTSNTWSMTFNPDTYDVGANGWPTLQEFFTRGTPIIVLTSNRNSPDFAYQWKYMSENVYGDASLDAKTWLDPRSDSPPLNQLDLCALNHFPSWTVSSFNLTQWIARANADNAATVLKSMADACQARWGRWPNYINADFWEVPTNAVIEAVTYLNSKLHGTPLPMRIENGYAILEDVDHSRLLGGDWARATAWVDEHFDEICSRPRAGQSGPLVYQLFNGVNLTVVLTTLLSVTPAGDTTVRPWLQQSLGRLTRYFLDLEPALLAALDAEGASAEYVAAIPFFLLERATDMRFDLTEVVRSRLARAADAGDHDQLLLAGLAGRTDAATHVEDRLAVTVKETQGPTTSSRLYDLTHEVLYLHHLRPSAVPGRELASHLEAATGRTMASNQDVGAELLAAYWLAGGMPTPAILGAVAELKAFSEAQPVACQKGRADECRCPGFKEQVHSRITLVLGLGMTLALHGEILDQPDDGAE